MAHISTKERVSFNYYNKNKEVYGGLKNCD
jgi:hypothetical protein